MGLRAELVHKDPYGKTHAVNINSAGYSGVVSMLDGTDTPVTLTYENLNNATPFATPVQKARLEVQWYADSMLFDEIFTSPEGQFSAEYYIDNILQWSGVVLPDLARATSGSFPESYTITAKDFSGLSGSTFGLQTGRRRIIDVIAECLNATGFALPIHTRTRWTETNIDSARDFLDQLYIEVGALRVYDAENGDQPLTYEVVLTELLTNFKLFARQTGGVWLLEQWSFTNQNRLVTVYNSAGVWQSASTPDVSVSANTSALRVITGTVVESVPGYKSVRTTFNHRTPSDGINIPVEFASVGSVSYSQPYVFDADSSLTLSGVVNVNRPNTPPIPSNLPGIGMIQIRVGNQYYNGLLNAWQTFPFTNIIFLRTVGLEDNGVTNSIVYNGAFDYRVASLPPASTVELLEITFFQYETSATVYTNVVFELGNSDDEKASDAITYELTQTQQFSVTYDDGATLYGDGPTAGAKSAIRFSLFGTLDLTTNWNRRGAVDDSVGLHNLIATEVMGFHRRSRRMLQGRLFGTFTPNKVLLYDGRTWEFLGGSFDVYSGQWSNVTLIENGFATDATDQFRLAELISTTNLTAGVYTALSLQRNDVLEAQGVLARLALPASGNVGQLFLTAPVEVVAGQFVRVVNPITAGTREFTVQFDSVSPVISVVPVNIGAEIYPTGSYVYFSARSVAAGIVVAENAVRVFNESTSIGELVSAVTGVVNSIRVRMRTRVRLGQDLEVTGRGGTVYRFESAAAYDVGEFDMDIRDTNGAGRYIDAPGGAIISTDPVFVGAYIQVDPASIRLEASEQIVLKAGTGLDAGKIATVGLYGDFGDGSVIDISADLVKINGIEFVEGTGVDDGYVQTDNYSSGVSGWKLFGDGSLEAQDVLLRGVILGFGATTDYFGNAINQSFNLSKRGLYFINDDTKIEESSIVQGDVDTTGITSKGLLFTYFDSVNSDYYTIELMYQRNGTFVPSSLIFKGIDDVNTTATDILEVRGPGSTNPNDLNYGFIKAHRDIIAEERVTIGTDLVISQRVFTQGINTIDTSTDFPYTVGATDYYVRIEDGGTIGGTITLPAATGSGRLLTFKDATGSAGAASFTIQRAGTDTIDGATSVSLNTNFGTVKLIDGASGKWDRI
jgi:hypothetical protein